MVMSNTEQNTIFQAAKALGAPEVVLVKSNEIGTTVYVLCACVPIRQMTAAEAGAYAVARGTTIASP